jgi:hypothetical protein
MKIGDRVRTRLTDQDGTIIDQDGTIIAIIHDIDEYAEVLFDFPCECLGYTIYCLTYRLSDLTVIENFKICWRKEGF